mgnify:CR=1 FL=1
MSVAKHPIALAMFGLALPWSSVVGAAVIDPDLEAAMQTGADVPFIAQFSERVDLSAFPGQGSGGGMQLAALLWALRNLADASQESAVELLKAGGAMRIIELWSINALAATASPDLVRDLAALPEIETIKLDAILAAPSPEPAVSVPSEWNLEAVQVPAVWDQGLTGTVSVVAGMDTGVDASHPDLAGRWRAGSNSWFDPNGEHPTPYDRSGHGTGTMSVAVGGDAGGTSIGVAPGAKWIAVKIFNDAGVASLSGIHQGFQWLLDPDGVPATTDIPDVVNNSWGFANQAGQCYLEFQPDLEVLKAAGIAVVFAAGNQGNLGSVSPANNPDGFGVGAVDSTLTVTWTSSIGPSPCDGRVFPEVVAPGVGVRAADLGSGYQSMSGTSFAAPHVAGAIALLRQAHPDASVAALEQVLTASATDIGPAGADNTSGHGLLNLPGALDLLGTLPPPGPVCTDVDGDAFFTEAGCGTPVDCNDLDPAINPAACDIKGDGIDQDCDGVDRRSGKDCPTAGGGTGGGKGPNK